MAPTVRAINTEAAVVFLVNTQIDTHMSNRTNIQTAGPRRRAATPTGGSVQKSRSQSHMTDGAAQTEQQISIKMDHPNLLDRYGVLFTLKDLIFTGT